MGDVEAPAREALDLEHPGPQSALLPPPPTADAATTAADDSDASDDEEVDAGRRRKSGALSRSQRRRLKEKARKLTAASAIPVAASTPAPPPPALVDSSRVTVEYVFADPATDILSSADAQDPELAQFTSIIRAFNSAAPGATQEAQAADAALGADVGDDTTAEHALPVATDDEAGPTKLSRKERKKQLQLSVAELKRSVPHPEVIEAHDVTSPDPKLLAFLKAARGSVPVPRHWCHKRRYLQGKRGIEKPPFALPDYIAATGITKMRNSDVEKGDDKTLKSKTRDRFAPKMGKIEIDYQVLHDAFFVHATKPSGLSKPGELYYEGRELEVRTHAATPGVLSDALRAALGMPTAAEEAEGLNVQPPPWLTAQQRYGPPPSYPRLRIPGVSAPLPRGATYGYQPGGWGKPPVDEYSRPLYGDVFAQPAPLPPGVATGAAAQAASGGVSGADAGSAAIVRHWGEFRRVGGAAAGGAAPAAGDAAEATPEEEVDGLLAPPAAPPDAEATVATSIPAADASALAGTLTPFDGTASVLHSVSGRFSGSETPDLIDIRKGGRGIDTPSASVAGPAPALYTILEEKKTALRGGLLGTTHAYVLPTAGTAGPSVVGSTGGGAAAAGSGAASGGGVAVALNPDELGDLDEAALANKYETELAATRVSIPLRMRSFVAVYPQSVCATVGPPRATEFTV